jgi:hypothetical protein
MNTVHHDVCNKLKKKYHNMIIISKSNTCIKIAERGKIDTPSTQVIQYE